VVGGIYAVVVVGGIYVVVAGGIYGVVGGIYAVVVVGGIYVVVAGVMVVGAAVAGGTQIQVFGTRLVHFGLLIKVIKSKLV
jgi:hypothetical protein